jgi:hypothetical protein
MNDETKSVELHDDSTKEEVVAYLKSKPPLFVDSVEVQGMSLCAVNPALVEIDDSGIVKS